MHQHARLSLAPSLLAHATPHVKSNLQPSFVLSTFFLGFCKPLKSKIGFLDTLLLSSVFCLLFFALSD